MVDIVATAMWDEDFDGPDTGWLEACVEALSGGENLKAASDFGDELRELLPPDRLAALREWVELQVEQRPEGAAGRLLARYLFG